MDTGRLVSGIACMQCDVQRAVGQEAREEQEQDGNWKCSSGRHIGDQRLASPTGSLQTEATEATGHP